MGTFRAAHDFSHSQAALFHWHERPGAFQRLNPPWNPAQVIHSDGHIRDGARIRLKIQPLSPFATTWELEHQNYNPPHQFQDRQIHGPFASWEHTHRFESIAPSLCRVTDDIAYRLPLEPLGAIGESHVQTQLSRLFAYRYRVLESDLAIHSRYPLPPLRIAISGASGLVGSALSSFLTTAGHSVSPIVRTNPRDGQIFWSPRDGVIDAKALEGMDAVIHLAGENIASGRWTAKKKEAIEASRIASSELLVQALRRLKNPPKTLISASAVGFYGDRGDELLTEESSRGNGFLPQTAERWEQACLKASACGCRVVMARFGVVLDPRGGALGKMLPAFRMGVGGTLGRGEQWMSWIAVDDLLYAVAHLLHCSDVRGAVNLCSPELVTNRQFTQTLATLLGRPAFFPLPKVALRALFGEMADSALLASTRVVPKKLADSAFHWCYPALKEALSHLLGLREKD